MKKLRLWRCFLVVIACTFFILAIDIRDYRTHAISCDTDRCIVVTQWVHTSTFSNLK